MNALMYAGDDVYAVEPFDRVEVEIDGRLYGGQVTGIHPRSGEVTVRYADSDDIAKRTGEPKRKTARVHVLAVELVARDG